MEQEPETSVTGASPDLEPVTHVWAGSPDGVGPWHRVAWQRHSGSAIELVALCGQVLAIEQVEQDEPHEFTDGLGCGQCASAMYEQATGHLPGA